MQNICYRCPTNCTTCSSNINSCTNCTNGTYLYNGQCISQCPTNMYTNTSISSCMPCTVLQCNRCMQSVSRCDSCNAPYILDLYYGCNNCTSGYLWDNSTRGCLPCDSTCLICTGNTNNCSSCAGGRVLLQGRCI